MSIYTLCLWMAICDPLWRQGILVIWMASSRQCSPGDHVIWLHLSDTETQKAANLNHHREEKSTTPLWNQGTLREDHLAQKGICQNANLQWTLTSLSSFLGELELSLLPNSDVGFAYHGYFSISQASWTNIAVTFNSENNHVHHRTR